MATYAVGDIHGCYDTFCRLLDKLKFDPEYDHLWVVGDMVNRGPKSLATLRYLKSLGDRCVAILGNHDLHLLAVSCGIRKNKNKDTLTELLEAHDGDDLIEWLRFRPVLHHDTQRKMTMVHAGIPPVWTIEQAMQHARQLEDALRSENHVEFLKIIYTNAKPQPWDERIEFKQKLQLIASYLTRMRFCNAQGVLDLESKGSTHKKGYAPWFNFTDSPCYKEHIIFGHWAALNGNSGLQNIHAIDTGCIWGKKLTAINIDSLELSSVAS